MRHHQIIRHWGRCFVLGTLGLWTVSGLGEEPKPGNVAPLAKPSASSSRPDRHVDSWVDEIRKFDRLRGDFDNGIELPPPESIGLVEVPAEDGK